MGKEELGKPAGAGGTRLSALHPFSPLNWWADMPTLSFRKKVIFRDTLALGILREDSGEMRWGCRTGIYELTLRAQGGTQRRALLLARIMEPHSAAIRRISEVFPFFFACMNACSPPSLQSPGTLPIVRKNFAQRNRREMRGRWRSTHISGPLNGRMPRLMLFIILPPIAGF